MYPCSMKHIPRIVLSDYICYSVGFFLFIVLLEPFETREFIKSNSNPYLYYVVEAICFFLILILCELFTSFLLFVIFIFCGNPLSHKIN